MVFQSSTTVFRPSMKWNQKALCVMITDLLFSIKGSMMTTWCLPVQAMVVAEDHETYATERPHYSLSHFTSAGSIAKQNPGSFF